MSAVAGVYADLIRKGVKTLDDVPDIVKDEVRELLKQDEKKSE